MCTAGLGYWTHEPDGSLPWPSWNARYHGHLHEGRPLYIHTYIQIEKRLSLRRKDNFSARFNLIVYKFTKVQGRFMRILVAFYIWNLYHDEGWTLSCISARTVRTFWESVDYSLCMSRNSRRDPNLRGDLIMKKVPCWKYVSVDKSWGESLAHYIFCGRSSNGLPCP